MALRVEMFLLISASFATVTVARLSRNSEGRLRDYLLNQANYTKRDRPVLEPNDTVPVKIRLQAYAMLDLNERDEVLTTASWMNLIWKDERLFWDPAEFGGIDIIVMHPDEIWIPKIFLTNSFTTDSLELTSPEKGSIILTSQGIVDLGVPLVPSTHCPLNVRYFPFDTQVCPFYFSPVNQYYQHMHLSAERTPYPSNLCNLEWILLNETITNFVQPFHNPHKDGNISYYSSTAICLYFKRNPNHYISTIIIPSTLMCVMAFATFLAPPDSGERISLGVSMVLGLTVFQLLISDTLPNSGNEFPVLGNYLTVNFILACLAVPLSLININIAYSDRNLKIMRHVWIKRLLLDYLPFYLCVYTNEDVRVTSEVMKGDSFQVNGQGEVNNTKGIIDISLNRNAVHPMEAIISKDHLASSGKTNCDSRTVALVMDRLTLIVLLIVFFVFAIKTVVNFNENPGVNFVNCEY